MWSERSIISMSSSSLSSSLSSPLSSAPLRSFGEGRTRHICLCTVQKESSSLWKIQEELSPSHSSISVHAATRSAFVALSSGIEASTLARAAGGKRSNKSLKWHVELPSEVLEIRVRTCS
jgi:hypothetical protein